ncbi:hypothetical protein Tco_1489248 [Tanacetum coccineum]
MVGCCFRNVKNVEESVALKELRLNTLRWKNDFATSAVQMQKQVKMQVALGDKSSSSSINFGSSSLIAKVHRGALVMSKR